MDIDVDKKRRKRKQRKIISLFLITGLTVVVLIVGTYAWFIGTGSVTTSSFSVGISTGEGLELSLNGTTWEDDTLTLSEESITGTYSATNTTYAYAGHTNHWSGASGLIPISTSGVVDSTSSRLTIYGKSSITATAGGFRLISSRIDNYSTSNGSLVSEKDGYIAFDLFIRNGTGDDYITEYNALDDEAIYLTTDSAVTVTANANPTEDYGLANSVRIAFAQIGRVKAKNASESSIIGINCATSGGNTGLCSNNAVIWEPNDTAHNANLITYFGNVCKTKTVTGGTPPTITYSTTPCTALVNGTYTNTYVVNSNILSSDQVDIYDGINGYTIPSGYKLSAIDTFTDTDKVITGQSRPTFFSLAPNSITKIRIYIYLEGQDVDNYDLISTSNTISVSFGFTKNQLNTAPTS